MDTSELAFDQCADPSIFVGSDFTDVNFQLVSVFEESSGEDYTDFADELIELNPTTGQLELETDVLKEWPPGDFVVEFRAGLMLENEFEVSMRPI